MKRDSGAAEGEVLFYQSGDPLAPVRTLLGTIYLLVRSVSLTVLLKSCNQINLPVCIDLQLPEILSKNISTYLSDVGLEQGLARQYLELPSTPSLLGPHATDKGTSSHPHLPC